MSKNKLNCGIIGLGRSGYGIHFPCLQKSKVFNIIALCDSDLEKYRDSIDLNYFKVYNDYKKLVKDSSIEIVIIASPTRYHFEMASQALISKKHIVLEKPLTPTIKETKILKKISINNNKYFFPFFNFRFVKEFEIIKKILEEKLIGKVFLIKRQVGYFNRRDDWQSLRSEYGGIINASAIHHIDQILNLVDSKPDKIYKNIQKLVTKGDAPDHLKLIVEFSNGCVADLEISWAEAFEGYPWLIYGTKGSIRQIDDKIECKWFEDENITMNQPELRTYFSNEKINWNYKSYKINKNYKLGMASIFYGKIASFLNKQIKNPISIDSAIKTMQFIKRIEHI